MKVTQFIREVNGVWTGDFSKIKDISGALVLIFGNYDLLNNDLIYDEISTKFNGNHLILSSTCTPISDNCLSNENKIVVTMVVFEKSTIKIETTNSGHYKGNYFLAGTKLAKSMPNEGLKYLLVVSEGGNLVNGSFLTQGIESENYNNIPITGGLCGDGNRYLNPYVGYNKKPTSGEIVLIGVYGEDLNVNFSCLGGWVPFGPERIVTKVKDNIIYEIDHMPALVWYKKYLGERVHYDAFTTVMFPLNIIEGNNTVVRMVFNVNVEEKSLILAGNVSLNSKVQLLMGTADRLIDGAKNAAEKLHTKGISDQLAIIISCLGRKIVLQDRYIEEIEIIKDTLGSTKIAGFYSYGEIAPVDENLESDLHNQTMTITLLSENE